MEEKHCATENSNSNIPTWNGAFIPLTLGLRVFPISMEISKILRDFPH